MKLSGLSHLVVEQVAVICALVAFLTGIVTVRTPPSPLRNSLLPKDAATSHENDTRLLMEKVVIVVIDALRADQVVRTKVPLMPFTHQQLARGSARGYVLHTAAPTVTLPRIKALVTGNIPGFMDVVENYGAGELRDDNIVSQWAARGKRIHFFGDDIWLRLLPHQFTKHDGVTSFFVQDYTEVDRNVSRHLATTLASDNWDVLILHYLGLDHIGHVEGPMSPLVGPKLLEMDAVIKTINERLEAKGRRYLVLVCGDHGMSDAGGHGGSSHSEVTTSAVLMSNTFPMKRVREVEEARQVDLASTLAFLTGMEPPQGNIGRPLSEVFSHFTMERKMYLHHMAARQLLGMARGSRIFSDHGNGELLFEEATRLHREVLGQAWQSGGAGVRGGPEAERVLKFYIECQEMMSDALALKLQSYDMPTIILATWAVVLILTVCLWRQYVNPLMVREVSSVAVWWSAGLSVAGWLLVCAVVYGCKLCSLLHPTPWLMGAAYVYVLVMIIHACNCVVTRNFQKSGSMRVVWYLLVMGTGCHTLSLLATSLVEEEHQTIYFLLNTLHLVLILQLLTHILRSSCSGKTTAGEEDVSGKRKIDAFTELPRTVAKRGNVNLSTLQKLSRPQNKIFLLLILSFVLSRVMRSWNATGDKWKHLEDLGDAIRAMGSPAIRTVVLLGLTTCLTLFHRSCPSLVLVTCGFIYGRHFPFLGRDVSRGTVEAQVAYIALIVLFVCGMLKAKLVSFRAHGATQKVPDVYEPDEDRLHTLLRYSYTCMSLTYVLLQRADNIGLVALVLLQNNLLCSVVYRLTLLRCLSWDVAALAVNWVAFAHFFYQGNSNSLSTVDVSAGFVGFTSYHPVLHGALIATQTFGGSFLTYLSYLTHIIAKDAQKERWQEVLRVWWCVRLATISLYLVNFLFQRDHLFIWSVFTPKLLYEGSHILVLFLLTLFMWIVEKVCTILEVTYRFE